MLPILERAAIIIGCNYTELADLLEAPRPALYAWGQIPARYVLRLEEITNGKLMRWEIREDLWPKRDFIGKNRRFELRESV